VNPKGIPAQSPRLLRSGYLESTCNQQFQPQRGCGQRRTSPEKGKGRDRVAVDDFVWTRTQGNSVFPSDLLTPMNQNWQGGVTPVRTVVARAGPIDLIQSSNIAADPVPSPLGGERVRVRGEGEHSTIFRFMERLANSIPLGLPRLSRKEFS
jgi:hypothetical protein